MFLHLKKLKNCKKLYIIFINFPFTIIFQWNFNTTTFEFLWRGCWNGKKLQSMNDNIVLKHALNMFISQTAKNYIHVVSGINRNGMKQYLQYLCQQGHLEDLTVIANKRMEENKEKQRQITFNIKRTKTISLIKCVCNAHTHINIT